MKNLAVYIAISIIVVPISLYQLGGIASVLHLGNNNQQITVDQSQTAQLQSPPAIPANTLTSLSTEPWVPAHISIDTVNIDLPVVSQPLVEGTWAVQEGVANYAQMTGLAGKGGGNIGIFAHDRADGFTNIKNLQPGAQITLSNNQHSANYIVKQLNIVNPNQVEVFSPTSNDELTLITCQGFFSQQRYVVKAQLLEETL